MEALVSPPAVEPLFLLLIFFYSCKYIQIYLYIDARLGRDGKVTPLCRLRCYFTGQTRRMLTSRFLLRQLLPVALLLSWPQIVINIFEIKYKKSEILIAWEEQMLIRPDLDSICRRWSLDFWRWRRSGPPRAKRRGYPAWRWARTSKQRRRISCRTRMFQTDTCCFAYRRMKWWWSEKGPRRVTIRWLLPVLCDKRAKFRPGSAKAWDRVLKQMLPCRRWRTWWRSNWVRDLLAANECLRRERRCPRSEWPWLTHQLKPAETVYGPYGPHRPGKPKKPIAGRCE